MVSASTKHNPTPAPTKQETLVQNEAKPLTTSRLGPKPYDLSSDRLPKRTLNYEPSHGYVESKFGTDLHVIQVKAIGPEVRSDTAVLFVPGFWSTATMNFPAMKELAAKGINSFSFSQDGHGRSGKLKTDANLNQKKINFSIGRYLSNLETVIKSIEASGVKNIHIVGHSFGGYLVQKYLASKNCANIASATLIASVPPAGMMMANLRFALKNPLAFAKANLTLNASAAMQDLKTAARILFSTTPEHVPKGCKLSPESLLANYQAMIPIDSEKVRASGVPITVVGTKTDHTISTKEVSRTAYLYNTAEKLIEGPHMWMADPLARQQGLEIITDVIKSTNPIKN